MKDNIEDKQRGVFVGADGYVTRLKTVKREMNTAGSADRRSDGFGQEDLMIEDLAKAIETCSTPSDYMAALVDHLEDPADRWSSNTLRVRILKRFIKYGNYLTSHGYTSRIAIRKMVEERTGRKPDLSLILRSVDDSYFAVLDDAPHDQKKRNGRYGLLKAADDLANGIVHSQNGSVIPLYLFGLCYGMRYSGLGMDAYHNFEERIFGDLYSNNLVHLLSGETIDQDSVDFSGRGINYKNPYELIYLYWMNRDVTAEQKVEGSGKMIQKLRAASKEKGKEGPAAETKTVKPKRIRTLKARSAVLPRNPAASLLALDEEAFLEKLVQTYQLQPEDRSGIMNVDSAQNTAWEVYRKARRDFFSLMDDCNVSIIENCYGLWFSCLDTGTDNTRLEKFQTVVGKASAYLGNTISIPGDQIWKERMEDNESMMIGYIRRELQREAGNCSDSLHRQEVLEILADPETLRKRQLDLMEMLVEKDRKIPYVYRASGPANVTRVRLLGVLYYAYNLRKDMEDVSHEPETLRQVFAEFKTFADPYLKAAFYPPLSMQMLFDSLLVYSSFFRNNV